MGEITDRKFEDQLREFLVQKGMTEEGLGTKMEPPVTKASVSNWLNRPPKQPSADTIRKIARALGVSPWEFDCYKKLVANQHFGELIQIPGVRRWFKKLESTDHYAVECDTTDPLGPSRHLLIGAKGKRSPARYTGYASTERKGA